MKRKMLTLSFMMMSLISASSVFADQKLCNYRDTIHLDNDSPFEIRILALSSNQNVIAEQRDATSFYIRDGMNCPKEGGFAFVRYGFDYDHFCDVVIKDGAFEKDPWWVSATCRNMRFNGLTHDGFMQYSYTLHFSY